MISITVSDPANSTPAELRAVANFLLAFAGAGAGTIAVEDNPAQGKDITPLPTLHPNVPPAPTVLEIPTAAQAFAPVPKPMAVPPAPFTAVAEVSSTVLAAIPGFSAPSAPPPPAPSYEASVGTAVHPMDIPASPASVELDAAGLPWNGDIHASSKAKVADGTWRKKRGLDKTEATPPVLAPTLVDVDAAIASSSNAAIIDVQMREVAPPPPPPPPAPPADPVVTTDITFAQLLPKITSAIAAGTLTNAQVVAVIQSIGLPALPMLATRLDLVPAVDAILFGG